MLTIQKLINELQRSVDELGFDSNATVLIDVIDDQGIAYQTSDILVDNDSCCLQLLSINAYVGDNEDEFIDFDKMNNSQKLAFLIERNGYIEDGTGLNEYGHEFRDDNGLALFIDERENEDE